MQTNHLRLLDACEGKKRRRRASQLLHFCFIGDRIWRRWSESPPPLARSNHHGTVLGLVVFAFLHLTAGLKGCDVTVQHIILDQTQVDAGVVQLPILILILILTLIQFLGRCTRVFRTGLDLSAQTEEAVDIPDPLAGPSCFCAA